jgi:ABC-2 type transport system permease protein
MAGSATLDQIALALIAPVLMTVLLAPITLWLYRKQ